MTTAYLVCGPESSGNRLLAAILSRSGCNGEGSTTQPKSPDELPHADDGPCVLIKHHNLEKWIESLWSREFSDVVAIVVIREPIANCKSMVARGHQPDLETAYKHRTATVAANLLDAVYADVQVEIVTYEGLTETFLESWLPRIGLPYKCGSILLPGQTLTEIRNQNEKHY